MGLEGKEKLEQDLVLSINLIGLDSETLGLYCIVNMRLWFSDLSLGLRLVCYYM